MKKKLEIIRNTVRDFIARLKGNKTTQTFSLSVTNGYRDCKIDDASISIIDTKYSADQAKGISMGEVGTTTEEKKVLFTYGLATCVGLYVYSCNFGILGHIDTGDMFGQHFRELTLFTSVGIRRHEIFYSPIINLIEQNKDRIIGPLKIGMIYGYDAETWFEERIKKIDTAIDGIIIITEDIGLKIQKQEPITSSYVIVDTNKEIIKTEHGTLENKNREI